MATPGMNVIVHPENLTDHRRQQLSQFIGNSKNFSSEDERKEAEKIYLDLLGKERELKLLLIKVQGEFKPPLKEPPKAQTFDLQTFSKVTGDNTLTKALQANFSTAKDAAWECMTLKQAHDSVNAMRGPEPQSHGVRPNRADRFGPKDDAKGQQPEKFVSKVAVGGQQTQPSKSKGEQPGPQAPVVEMDRMEEHMWRLHHHRFHGHFDLGFPNPDGEPLPQEPDDDSGRVTLLLLWTYQDFFEAKVLSKAQAEFSFYRNLDRQWKKTLRRVKLDEIKYPAFSLKDFNAVPRYRTLYAVLKFLLETKDNNIVKVAQAAAEEYQRFSVLEQHMAKERMISSVPQGIDLDNGMYNEICREIKEKFKQASSKAKPREKTQFKSVSLFDYLKLKETITSQRNQIDDLASKLSGIASQQLADGDPGFTDLGDKNRPQKLGERFAELFDETWSSAYESLKPKNLDADDDESDEKTMDTLQKIVKVIYDFCQKVSVKQLQRLLTDMIPPIENPVNEQPVGKPPSEQMKSKTEQTAREYRKVVAQSTVTVLQKEIFEKDIKGKLLPEPVSAELKTYVDQCVDLIWYMCIQLPPMEIRWAVEGEKFNREHFRFSGRKGKKYKLTVWPAVFLHKDGPLVAPGYAVPSK